MFIKQDNIIDDNELSKRLKSASLEVRLDRESIEEDIIKYRKREKEVRNKIAKANYKNIRMYLTQLRELSKRDSVELEYSLKNKEIISTPIRTEKFGLFNVQFTDYVKAEDGVLITVDYSRVLDLMAMELAYRDWGYTQVELEKMLEVDSIITINNTDKLEFIEKNAFEKTCGMLIEDTPYTYGGKILDYYGEEVNDCRGYSCTLNRSANKTMAWLVCQELRKFNTEELEAKLVAVYYNSIIFRCKKEDMKKVVEQIEEEVIIRVFGRKYSIKPDVKTF